MSYLKQITVVIVLLLSAGVHAEQVSYGKLLKLNAENLNKITQGMSEDQVKKIMGNYTSAVRDGSINNPWRTERVGDTTILHYLVRKHPPFTPLLENQSESVIIENNKVVSVGRQYLKTTRLKAAGNSESTTATANTKSLEERLKSLKDLYDSGAIGKATYEEQKKRILDSI
jgi:hypothetical protein